MPVEQHLLAIDQGTSATKAMVVDRRGRVVSQGSAPLGQSRPYPGWVEQSSADIWASIQAAVGECLAAEGTQAIAGLALSVQRESVVLWDRRTGDSVGPVLSWQDQRTRARAEELERGGHGAYILGTTGLPLDPMFSALKAQWLLDEYDPRREHTSTGAWCVGTVDAWILSRFAGEPITEIGSSSRTQLLDISSGSWDPGLADLFGVPLTSLPSVVPSTGPFPAVRGLAPVPDGLPVLAVLADSHAALFAHAGWRAGVVKATYGTGTSVMALSSSERPAGASGLCSTIAWQTDKVAHALEANIRSTGRTLTWLAELLSVGVDVLWAEAAESSSGGVVMVPAFGGLGAPYWDREAAASISGLSLHSGRPQLARAAVEAIAHQVDDVLLAFHKETGPLHRLVCDGGMTKARALMQLQADLSDLPVHVSPVANLSAMGAAHLAGLAAGWWDYSDLEAGLGDQDRSQLAAEDMVPRMETNERASRRARWATAVQASRTGVPALGTRCTP